MKKRILCLLLAVCLLAGCLPLGAGAETADETSLAEAIARREKVMREEAVLMKNEASPLSAPKAEDPAATLISYIQKNGEVDSDGDQYVRYAFTAQNGQNSVVLIYYIPSYNEILFLVYHIFQINGQQVTVGSAIDYDLDTRNAVDKTITVYIEDDAGEDQAAVCTNFDVRTYTEDTNLRFAWEDGSPETSGFQELCNSITNLSVLSCELALEQLGTGVTLPDLGFGYFNAALTGFVDVNTSDYFYEAVNWAAAEGITAGTDAAHFSPSQSCTRAQVVTFLWRAAGGPEPLSTGTAFTDVALGAYYEKAVRWAVENGITAGTSAAKFSPNAICTRAQVVTFLWRATGGPEPENTSTTFTDVTPGAYYEKAVKWAVENEITAGLTTTTFGPDNRCTRGQVVSFLYRYCG